jgi:hypothetical protein
MSFPANPIDGYVDASIYLDNAHNPIEITTINFGVVDHRTVPVQIIGTVLFEFEGWRWANCPITFETTLTLLPSRPE